MIHTSHRQFFIILGLFYGLLFLGNASGQTNNDVHIDYSSTPITSVAMDSSSYLHLLYFAGELSHLKLDSLLNPIGNLRVETFNGWGPHITTSKYFLGICETWAFYKSHAFFKIWTSDGDTLISSFFPSNTTTESLTPVIQTLDDSSFQCTWVQYPKGTSGDSAHILTRYHSLKAEEQDTSWQVNDFTVDYTATPHMTYFDNDSLLLVVWKGHQLYGRGFTRYGNPQGSSFRLFDSHIDTSVTKYRLVKGSDNTFGVVFVARNASGDWTIFWRWFDLAGNPVTSLQEISPIGGKSGWSNQIAVSTNDWGQGVLCWEQLDEDRWRIRGLRFNEHGTIIGEPFFVAYKDSAVNQTSPSVTMYKNKVYVFWTESNGQGGGDIRGKLFPYNTPPTRIVNTNNTVPSQFILYPNYPNPFNSSTQIKYQLPQHTKIEIEIFDLKGRLIQKLFAGTQQAGVHSFIWDGINQNDNVAPSGLYYLILSTPDRVFRQKLLLIK